MVDNISRTNFSDENHLSFPHSHTYSTRPVVARFFFYIYNSKQRRNLKYNFKYRNVSVKSMSIILVVSILQSGDPENRQTDVDYGI